MEKCKDFCASIYCFERFFFFLTAPPRNFSLFCLLFLTMLLMLYTTLVVTQVRGVVKNG